MSIICIQEIMEKFIISMTAVAICTNIRIGIAQIVGWRWREVTDE